MATLESVPGKTADVMYPIYLVSVKWTQDGPHDPQYPNRHKDLPEGRVLNSTGYTTMLREPDLEGVQAKAREWWEKYEKKGENPSGPEFTVKFVRNEAWCGGWFSHWTFDVGQSDEEVLASFERFVERMQDLNQREGKLERFKGGMPYWSEPYCLMGAEDRYRWCASPEAFGILGPLEHHEPPCRCDGCKKHGIIRIDH